MSRILEFQSEGFSEQEENDPARNFLEPSYTVLAFETEGMQPESAQHLSNKDQGQSPTEIGSSSMTREEPTRDSSIPEAKSTDDQATTSNSLQKGVERVDSGIQDDNCVHSHAKTKAPSSEGGQPVEIVSVVVVHPVCASGT